MGIFNPDQSQDAATVLQSQLRAIKWLQQTSALWFDKGLQKKGRRSPAPSKIVFKGKSEDAIIDELVYNWTNRQFDREAAKVWFGKIIADFDRFNTSDEQKEALERSVDHFLSKLH